MLNSNSMPFVVYSMIPLHNPSDYRLAEVALLLRTKPARGSQGPPRLHTSFLSMADLLH